MMEMQITTNPIYRINYNTNRLVYAVLHIISDTYEDTIGDFPPIIILTKIRILFILSKKIIKNEDFFAIFPYDTDQGENSRLNNPDRL